MSRTQDYFDTESAQTLLHASSTNPIVDMRLLGDVVDAYKHAELSNKSRLVHSSKVTIVIGSGWGEMHYGEGNYGGLD